MVDLHRQYLGIRDEVDRAIGDVIAETAFIKGPAVGLFEEELARRLEVRHCIACGNGTDALLLSLLAVGLQRGDEVIVPAFAFAAVAETVLLLGGGLLIAVSLFTANIYPTFSAAFHHALFQFVSLVTTTGFATADSNQWTSFAVILLIFGSIVCACAGSTAGGIKTNRLVLAMKMMRTRLRQQQHPNAIIRIKLDGVIQENEALHSVMIFIVAYLMLILAGTVLGTMFGVDLMTSFSGSVASIGNVGPGFGQVGSMDNFSSVPGVFKISSSLLMLLGRLEIFGLIQLFFIKWWR